MTIEIIQGDSLQVMKTFDDNQFDLCLTDPPYGVGLEYDMYSDTQDNTKELLSSVMPEMLRVSKRVMLTCGQTNMWHYPEPNWVMAWVNPAGTNRNSWGFTCWQPILCYGKDPYLASGKGARQDIIRHSEASEKNGHPCPKPRHFWKKLLLRGSISQADKILDPFLGSGTTAVVSECMGRDCVGIEISEEYCEIARKRVQEEKAKMGLFNGEMA